MTEFIFIYGLIVHWIADFVLQSHEQAVNKSKSIVYLLEHTVVYSAFWYFAMFMAVSYKTALGLEHLNDDQWLLFVQDDLCMKFALITLVAHTITDFVTSRIVKHFFNKKDYHNGFLVIGIDQILHYLQLYFTYKYIFL